MSALLAGALVLMMPAIARADNPVAIGNAEATTVSFSIRCIQGSDTGWHQFSLQPGEYKWFNSNLWGQADLCPGIFEMSIPTQQANGSVTRQLIRLDSNETSYVIVKTRSVGYYAHPARTMIVVTNDSSRAVSMNYKCAPSSWAQMYLAPGATSWVYTGERPCSPYVAAIIEQSGQDATLPTTPLPPGYIYTLRWNDAAGRWNLLHVTPDSKAPD
ncbi:MAG TPA: hypothetical protein VHT53_02550 [Candidatus Elarobacter sp.]|jgi:hypothetical protein|nr:hypothetical protein [Candidatus Elarobacter sp.]